jgi:peptide/nickel transport system substrate-binding protein
MAADIPDREMWLRQTGTNSAFMALGMVQGPVGSRDHRVDLRDRPDGQEQFNFMSPPNTGPTRALFTALRNGQITRRQFMERSALAGVGGATAVFLANTAQAGAQGASPEASATTAAAERPASNTENQTRGEGGDLRILQWQAPSLLSPFNASGVKDYLASVPVLEPLLHYMTDATLIPNLVKEVPSQENGLLAEDLTSVTYNLLEGVTWSDGTPFTANDVRFTWEWQVDADGKYQSNSVSIQVAETIKDVEVIDDLTLTVHFNNPNPLWFENHAGTSTGFIYPKHILDTDDPPAALQNFLSNPIGTGPYVVESFAVNDQVVYAVNENYREPNKPYFSRVTIKGGGDAASAARAVIQTGDYDFAWNLQVEPDVLADMEAEGNPGYLLVALGTNVERIDLQQADPNTEVDGQRAEVNTPHPFFSDKVVREALTLAIDRETIANSFYEGGDAEPAAANLLEGIAAIESPNNEVVYDPERAMQILDEAGWTLDGNVRQKDGVELSVRYATSINQVRQKTQAVVKSNLEAVGFQVELISVDAGIYFDTAPGNEQNIYKFYWDLEMFQSVPTNPTPITYMENWYAGPDNSNVSQASNQWTGGNTMRYVNPEYDALLDQARTETDPEALADLFIQMNDMVVSDFVSVPLVRVGSKNGVSYTLNEENLELGPFSYHYWNIANWNRKAE